MTAPINSERPINLSYSSNYKVNAINPLTSNNQYYSLNEELESGVSKKFDRVEISQKAREYLNQTECETCDARKYKDVSDDAGVSFKSPRNISPQQSRSLVASHENEHVMRNSAKAERENKEVISQSVALKTDICPECHEPYVSGGQTTTVTRTQSDSGNGQYNGVGKRLNCLA